MCSVSKVNEMLNATSGASGAGSAGVAVPQIPAVKLRHSRNSFFLIDVREADEVTAKPLPADLKADAEIPMGKLFVEAKSDDRSKPWKKAHDEAGRRIVLFCPTGNRASVAASELISKGFASTAIVSRGTLGLTNPAATVPDLLVLLANATNGEKITLALTASAVAAADGKTVVLGLMSEGVEPFIVQPSPDGKPRIATIPVGEPFQPAQAMLDKFLSTGNGVVLGCSSCIKQRKLEFQKDLLDSVQPMQMPDLLRMQFEAKANLQFM